jgi:outer membrane protein TolC
VPPKNLPSTIKMISKIPFVFTAAAMLVCGCAHYRPQPLAPQKTAEQWDARRLDDAGLKGYADTHWNGKGTSWPPAKWNLDSLTVAAFYFHPDLAVAQAQWKAAVAGIETAGGRPNPVVSAGPGYNFTTAGATPWMPFGSVDLPVETAGKRGKRIAAAEAAAESARWNFINTAWQIRSGVRAALLDHSAAERRLPLLQKQLEAQQEIVRLLQGGFDAGATSRPEITTAQLALHKAQLDFSSAQAKLAETRSKLAEAIGVSPAALDSQAIANDPDEGHAHDLTSGEARRAALLGRADIRMALADYAESEENLRLEIAKQFPDVHLNPGYQFDQGDSKWTFGLTFELPLLNQNQGPIAEAKAKRELAAAKFLQLQSQIAAQVDRAAAGWHSAQAQLKTSNELTAAAERQQQSVAAQATAGAAARSDLAAAEIDFVTIQLAQLDSQVQVQATLGTLEDALQQPSENFDLLKMLSQNPDKNSH